jgi:membrane-anchored protein YejM (alkaline phosphatase superfamily)
MLITKSPPVPELRQDGAAVSASVLMVSMPVSLAIGLALFAGQLLQLRGLPAFTLKDYAAGLLSFFSSSIVLTMIPVIVCGLLNRVWRGFASAALWMVSLSVSTAYVWDHFSYQWLALHLDDSIPMLVQNAGTDFLVMRSKMTALIAVLAAYIAVLILGTVVTRYVCRRFSIFQKPVAVRALLVILALGSAGYAAEQLISPYTMTPKAYQARAGALWQLRFRDDSGMSTGRAALFTLDSVQFKQRPGRDTVERVLAGVTPQGVEHPLNIFVFVVDSLRADQINPDTAPHLWRLGQRSLNPHYGIASGNCTHISWFSIANGTNPLYWSVIAHQPHSDGAIPLRALKKAGYTIRAISTPQLNYFGFARVVFGDNQSLADSIVDQGSLFDPKTKDDPGDLDQLVIKRLLDQVDHQDAGSRSFDLVMLDAPHHDYTWAKDYQAHFVPFMEKVPLLSTRITLDNVGLLKNRYKNAVSFDDELFGRFLKRLEERNLLESSIVVVTGDHGEEFLENGHLVHSSEFDSYQLRVPIIMYIPEALKRTTSIEIASHSSIFPTIFDVIGLKADVNALLDGKSMLQRPAGGIAFSAMCASSSPSRILVDNADQKVELEFAGIGKIGTMLLARKMFATAAFDGEYHELTGDEAKASSQKLVPQALQEILVKR